MNITCCKTEPKPQDGSTVTHIETPTKQPHRTEKKAAAQTSSTPLVYAVTESLSELMLAAIKHLQYLPTMKKQAKLITLHLRNKGSSYH